MTGCKLKKIQEEDAQLCLDLVKLAVFEKMPTGPKISSDQLAAFIREGNCFGYIIYDEATGEVAGHTLCYFAYSTWEGRYIYMEELYVRPQYRRQNYGTALFSAVGKLAIELNCARVEWKCLDWNRSAIVLYEKYGAADMRKAEGWIDFRLHGESIAKLAEAVKSNN